MKDKIIKLWPFLLTMVLLVAAWGVLTVRAVAPITSSFSPVDGSNFVASSSNFVINFDQPVFAGAGYVYIKRANDDVIVESIPAASTSLVSISNSQVTINPASVLERDGFFYITIDDDAFRNGSGEYYAGFSDKNTWNFHVVNDLFIWENLKNIQNHGKGINNIGQSIAVGDEMYFIAGFGTELWKTDGTENGTVLVKYLYVDMTQSNNPPDDLVVMGGVVYFVVHDHETYGTEIWRSDGTGDGTYVLRDINLGSSGSSVNNLFAYNGYIYFSAYDSVNGTELWRSDGTEAGTVMVRNINAGTNGSYLGSFAECGSYLCFNALNSSYGYEVWRTDGTSAGTVLVKDIFPGTNGSYPSGFKDHDGILYFKARSSGTTINNFDNELWRTDGTTAGTYLVKDILPGNDGSSPSNLLSCGDFLYFSANDGVNGRELWRSNGTTSGTVLVKDINASSSDSEAYGLLCSSSILYFQSNDGVHGWELWRSNGYATGTEMIMDVGNTSNDLLGGIVYFNGWIYYTVDDGVHGEELWRTKGTASTTELFLDAYPGLLTGLKGISGIFGNMMFFWADSGSGFEPWVTDGTIGGTYLLKEMILGNIGSDPRNFFEVNSKVFFTAYDVEHGEELWTSDGTASGTTLFMDINPGQVSGAGTCLGFQTFFKKMGEVVYFSACDPDYGDELWRTDGTVVGTYLVKDINPFGGSEIAELTVVGDRLYFQATNGVDGLELWQSDGTSLGTVMFMDINPSGDSSPANFVGTTSEVFFVANDGVNGSELWISDGTSGGTSMVKNINPNEEWGVGASYLFYYNGELYFRGDDNVDDELWKSDGTSLGTNIFEDISPSGGSYVSGFLAFNNKLCFSGDQETDWDNEMLCTDGITPGVVRLADFDPVADPYYGSGFFGENDSGLIFQCSEGTCFSDGTASNTIILVDVDRGNYFPIAYGMTYANLGNEVYGVGSRRLDWSGTENESLWRFAETASKTVPMIDLYAQTDIDYRRAGVANIISSNQRLFFSLYDSNYGVEPYVAYYVSAPSVTTGATSSISANSVVLGGLLIDKGLSKDIERGLLYGTSSGLTIDSPKFYEVGEYATGTYSASISSLSCGTNYFYRAYARNKAGVVYGEEKSFNTSACVCPVVSNAASYNAYPTCGPASCVSGYHVSGSICEVDSSSGGSGGGGGGSAVVIPSNNASSSFAIPLLGGSISKSFSDGASVTVVIPQGSVDSNTSFQVSKVAFDQSNTPAKSSGAILLGTSIFNINAFDIFNREVDKFKRSLTITIKVPDLPATTSDLAVYYFNEETKKWTLVPGAVFDVVNKKVSFTSDHLTIFAIFSILGIKPSFGTEVASAKEDSVGLISPDTSEATNIVNAYYRTIDTKLEESFYSKTAKLKGFEQLSKTERDAIAKMVAYGTPSTMFLGAGERLGVINSYLSAFGHLPKTVDDFNDVIKISTGHWPKASNLDAIARAKISFKKIYLREANMENPNDNAAVTIMAYGLRSAKRNMNSEKAAISIYKRIFKKAPSSAVDWDAVRAIAYSGAKR